MIIALWIAIGVNLVLAILTFLSMAGANMDHEARLKAWEEYFQKIKSGMEGRGWK